MSWSGIASNQCVSCENLQDAVTNGIFTLKNTIPSSTPAKYKQITKAEANNYVNLDSSYAPFAAKSFNQLVVKSNLQPCTNLPYSYTLVYYYQDGDPNYVGYLTSAEACAATSLTVTVYSSSSTIGVGTALYFDSCGTEPINASATSYLYFKIGGNYVTFQALYPGYGTGHIINSVNDCGGGLATINIATNISLDIQLYQSTMTVNGVGVTNISGVNPNSPGNGGSVQTNQIGFYDITFTYYCSVSGQSIQLIDSSGAYQCNNASTGFTIMTFFGVTINTSVDLTITCVDGMCY
jgi:hypothetical protein